MKSYRLVVVSAAVLASTILASPSLPKEEETLSTPPLVIPYVPSPLMPREFVRVEYYLSDIFFDRGSAKVRKDMRTVLDKNAEWLKKNENYLIVIEGHTDEIGTNESNLYLSEKRAKTVYDHLVAAGIESRRITIIGYGEERPMAWEHHNEETWKQNRRASFLIKTWR